MLMLILLVLYVLLLSQGVHNSHINIPICNQSSSLPSLTSRVQARLGRAQGLTWFGLSVGSWMEMNELAMISDQHGLKIQHLILMSQAHREGASKAASGLLLRFRCFSGHPEQDEESDQNACRLKLPFVLLTWALHISSHLYIVYTINLQIIFTISE